jgi:Abortive infection C-terminus
MRERAVLTDPAVLEEHLARIRDGLTSDPAAAISSSKNLLESLFRIVLDRSQIDYGARDIPQLYRKVADLLELKAESVPGSAKGSEASQQVLRTLVTTVQSLAELRNELGIGGEFRRRRHDAGRRSGREGDRDLQSGLMGPSATMQHVSGKCTPSIISATTSSPERAAKAVQPGRFRGAATSSSRRPGTTSLRAGLSLPP